MKIFESNPYRVLGIKANASASEKEAAKNTINAFLKIGKEPVLDFDLCPPLEQILRTTEIIDLKSNEILNDTDKINHSIFWFISGGVIDDIALSKLTKSKDFESSRENLLGACNNFEVHEGSVCSIINYSTLEIISYYQHKDRVRLKLAINHKLSIAFSSEYINFLSKYLNTNSSKIDLREVENEVILSCKKLLIELFPSEDEEKLILEFFKAEKGVYDKYLNEITSKKIQSVKLFVTKTDSERGNTLNRYSNNYSGLINNESLLFRNCGKLGTELYDNTVSNLNQIKKSLGADHTSTIMIYEAVMNELNFCGVLPLNSFMEKFSSSSESNQKEMIKALKPEDLAPIIDMTTLAIKNLGDVNTIILRTMKDNLESYKSFHDTLRNAASNNSGGDGDGGCIGLIIKIIIYGAIAAFFFNTCE